MKVGEIEEKKSKINKNTKLSHAEQELGCPPKQPEGWQNLWTLWQLRYEFPGSGCPAALTKNLKYQIFNFRLLAYVCICVCVHVCIYVHVFAEARGQQEVPTESTRKYF